MALSGNAWHIRLESRHREVGKMALQPWTKMSDIEFRVRVFESSMKFNNIPRNRRTQELKKYAEKCGILISICGVCEKVTGGKEGHGISGLSHGYCGKCLLEQYKDIANPSFLRGIEKTINVEKMKDFWFEQRVMEKRGK